MKRTLILSGLTTLALLSGLGQAMASGDYCSVPKAEWQPKEALEAKLKTDGWDVRKIKIEDGCYEVYGIDAAGAKQEVLFNPKTFELVRKS